MTTSEELKMAQLEAHLRSNSQSTYGAAIVIAALFHKLYRRLPRIGLSGAQADAAIHLQELLPTKEDDDSQLKFKGV